MKLGLIISTFLIAGCGAGSVDRPAYNAGDYLAAGILRGLDDPAAKQAIDDIVSGAVASSRDAVLDDKTRAWVLDLETALLLKLRKELHGMVLQSKQDVFDGLDAKIRSAVEAAVTGTSTKPSLGAFAEVREELLGAPLRQDLHVMLSDLDPVLQDMIKRASANAVLGVQGPLAQDVAVVDQNLEKWKYIAITLAVAVGILVFMHAHAVHAMSKRND
jgi:hypothetical protein